MSIYENKASSLTRESIDLAIAKLRADAVSNARMAIREDVVVIPPGMEIGTLSADGDFVPHVNGGPAPTHARRKGAA